MTWYVIKTNPKAERKATSELRRAGLRVYLPKWSFEVPPNRRVREARVRYRPLLIGYLLVRFPGSMLDLRGRPPFGIARGCQGVLDLLRWTDDSGERSPVPIPDQMVRVLMHRQRVREFDDRVGNESRRVARRAKFWETVRPGVIMLVAEGPFAGREVVIDRVHDNDTVTAMIRLFGRPNPKRFDNPQAQLMPLAESAAAA